MRLQELLRAVQAVGTLAEVAQAAGWSPSLLSAVLRAKRRVNRDRAERLAQVLSVPVEAVPHWLAVGPVG